MAELRDAESSLLEFKRMLDKQDDVFRERLLTIGDDVNQNTAFRP